MTDNFDPTAKSAEVFACVRINHALKNGHAIKVRASDVAGEVAGHNWLTKTDPRSVIPKAMTHIGNPWPVR
jgi:hypothetical protein